MFRRLLPVLLVLLATAPAAEAGVSVGHSGWEWSNPLPQGNAIRALAFEGTRGYAGGAFGTLLRSDDGGESWTGLSPGITEDVVSLETIRANSLVVAGGCALRRSDDVGGSFRRLPWTARELPCRSPIASVAFPVPDVGYVLREDGRVYRSGDGGLTWNRMQDLPDGTAAGGEESSTGLAFGAPDSGIATTTSGIFRTTDGGTSWSSVAERAGGFGGAAFGDALAGLAAGAGGSVYRTRNGGLTWSATPAVVVSGPAPLNHVSCGDSGGCLVTSEAGDRVLSTIDGGSTWTVASLPGGRALAAAFSAGARVIVGGTGGSVSLSDDGGLTWSTVGSRLPGAFARLSGNSGSLTFAFGSAGTIARTADGGVSWSYLAPPTPEDLLDVSFADEGVGFAVDATGVLHRTGDAGASWLRTGIDSSVSPQAVLALDGGRVVLAGARGIRRSLDSGATFQRVGSEAVRRTVLFGIDHAGGSLYAYGPTTLLASRDGGGSWRRLGRPDHRPLAMVDFVSSRTGFALGKGGRLWRTRDRGRSWRELVATGTDGSFQIAFSNPHEGYAIASDVFFAAGFGRPDYVLRTTDGGASFSPQLVAKSRDMNAIITMRDGTGFLLAGDSQLFSTVTGGSSGRLSHLRLHTRRRRLDRPRRVTISGRLSPPQEGQRIVVSAAVADPRQRKGATDWDYKSVRVGSDGRFSSRWSIRRTSVFVAQWTGDGAHRGAGSRALRVTVPKRRRR